MEYFDGEPYMTYKIDAALLRMKNPDIYATNLARTKSLLTCAETPRIGEDVVILGYPSIGSSESITATDGIISGLEEFYFITSAKVEHGNSGGAGSLEAKIAIWVFQLCANRCRRVVGAYFEFQKDF